MKAELPRLDGKVVETVTVMNERRVYIGFKDDTALIVRIFMGEREPRLRLKYLPSPYEEET